MTDNIFHGYEQADKFLFVRPTNIVTIYQRGNEHILETDQHQYVIKKERFSCVIEFTKPLVKLTGEYQGDERTILLNPDKITGIELHNNDYHIQLTGDRNFVIAKLILERTENVGLIAV